MKKLFAGLFLAGAIALIPAGCVNNARVVVTGLSVELTGIECTTDGAVMISWRIVNPNISPYLMSRVSQRIEVNGTKAGTILDEDPLGVPANGGASRTSKLTGANAATIRMLAGATGSSVSYRVVTQLTVRIYDETIERAEISNSGTVPVTTK